MDLCFYFLVCFIFGVLQQSKDHKWNISNEMQKNKKKKQIKTDANDECTLKKSADLNLTT